MHRSRWPEAGPLREAAGEAEPNILPLAAEVLTEVRRAKSEAKRSMRAPVTLVSVIDTPERLACLRSAVDDIKAAGVVADLTTEEGPDFVVEVELAPEA